MSNIELHIEKLTLHGFSHADSHGIGEAVKLELARLYTERGVSNSTSKGGTFSRLDGGRFSMAPNSKAEAIGSRVAQSIYKSMDVSQSRKER